VCGIAGFVDTGLNATADELRAVVGRMAGRIARRGPDDHGAWADPASGVALGHRRLAILDLTSEGHQPMRSGDGRFVIVFNGEIYNFLDLRRQLESSGQRLHSQSDTEVLLEGCRLWGVQATLEKCVGMFAFALWDGAARSLSLARDRLGEKPLYYGWQRGVFMFGSDVKAFGAHPGWQGEIDRNAAALLMRLGYIPAPYAIYRDIRKLPAATLLTLTWEDLRHRRWGVPTEYWSMRACAERGVANPLPGTDADAVDALDAQLRDSVRLQMVADVPLGAFLSGGIDSSTVVAMMQAQSTRPVRTFSIGFHEDAFNEARHAMAVAKHLGTDHTELYVTPHEAMAVVPSLADVYSEPFADPSQIPTCLVSALARRHVTVCLSGDGGDELFSGYQRYERGMTAWRIFDRIPRGARAGIGSVLGSLPVPLLNRALRIYDSSVSTYSPESWNAITRMLRQGGEEGLCQWFLSHWREPNALVIGSGNEPPHALTDRSSWADVPEFVQRMMYVDTVGYLPDDVLAKVDRATMSVSLEGRVPLLDHRVVELAWRIPMRLKRRDGQGKWPLRQVLHRYVPSDMVERPKMGFGVPIGAWLRGPLRDWAEALIAESRLKNEGYLSVALVREKWAEHLSGARDHDYAMWTVLMFQAWLERSRTPSEAGVPDAVPA
jgi:asparagine synthase (glutamine-hydrolysing)